MSDSPPEPPRDPIPGPILITVKPQGTIVVYGQVRVEDLEGNRLTIPVFKQPGVIKLCGCGRSANKPFCDGSHKRGESVSPSPSLPNTETPE